MTLSQDSPSIQSPVAAPLAHLTKPKSFLDAAIDTAPSWFATLGRQPQPIRIPGTDCIIKPQVPLASLTSFKVGGPAELYVAPRRIEDLQASLDWANRRLPITLLGAGSNLLISDQGLSGLVICTRHLRATQFDEAAGQVTVAAGEPLSRLAWRIAERGWRGFEWAVGIPGTVGGAIVMNAGAHSACTADVLINAEIFYSDGNAELLLPEQLNFAYRTSALQVCGAGASAGPLRLVTQATLQLQSGYSPEQVMADTMTHMTQRRTTQPYNLPSCGSVFRNPTPYKAGWLIEQAGLKGHQIGGAQIAQRHANFILNCGGATAGDIFALIRHIQNRVEQQWSLRLEPEVKMLGEFQPA